MWASPHVNSPLYIFHILHMSPPQTNSCVSALFLKLTKSDRKTIRQPQLWRATKNLWLFFARTNMSLCILIDVNLYEPTISVFFTFYCRKSKLWISSCEKIWKFYLVVQSRSSAVVTMVMIPVPSLLTNVMQRGTETFRRITVQPGVPEMDDDLCAITIIMVIHHVT